MRTATILDLFESLMQLLTPDGVQASTWELYQGAIFGRDSERVALDLLPWFENVSLRVIFSLIRYQGMGDNDITEEEVGRIHHEYRHLFVGGRKVGPIQQQLLRELSERWGGSDKEMIYYGTVDATPQLVRLIAAHCRLHGKGILQEEFIHRNGTVRTVKDSLLAAIRWTVTRIEQSDLGLLEFKRRNPRGLRWQAMRDGSIAYLHANGDLANANAPIASLEVQGLAYDALLYGAELLQEELPDEAKKWVHLAHSIQATTLKRFWIPEENFFAMAIDRDPKGDPRLVSTISSVPAELLETRIFDSLEGKKRDQYISAIIKQMYGPDFLTDVGIRSRALRYHQLVPLWDYQGSKVSWVVTTNIFALGLRRQGFPDLAMDMENRMLNGVNLAGSMLEYFYVDINGRVNYHNYSEKADGREIIVGTNIPENTQAWTVSALLGILLRRERAKDVFPSVVTEHWQRQTELSILEKIRPVKLLENEEELTEALPEISSAYVNKEEGSRIEREFLERFGYKE
jgi:glycogen debranching enzyme